MLNYSVDRGGRFGYRPAIFVSLIDWFILSGMNESKLEVQVRTTRVGDVNATGFTALAMKEGNAEVVQMNLNSTGIIHCCVHNN